MTPFQIVQTATSPAATYHQGDTVLMPTFGSNPQDGNVIYVGYGQTFIGGSPVNPSINSLNGFVTNTGATLDGGFSAKTWTSGDINGEAIGTVGTWTGPTPSIQMALIAWEIEGATIHAPGVNLSAGGSGSGSGTSMTVTVPALSTGAYNSNGLPISIITGVGDPPNLVGNSFTYNSTGTPTNSFIVDDIQLDNNPSVQPATTGMLWGVHGPVAVSSPGCTYVVNYTLNPSGTTGGASAISFELMVPAGPFAEVSQVVLEVFGPVSSTVNARVSQVDTEAFATGTSAARVSQVDTEVFTTGTSNALVSQLVTELFVPATTPIGAIRRQIGDAWIIGGPNAPPHA